MDNKKVPHFLAHPFFTHLQIRPLSGFLQAIAQTMRSRTKMWLLGVTKFEINI